MAKAARKKKAPISLVGASPVSETPTSDGLFLTRAEVMALRAYQAERDLADKTASVLRMQMEQILAQIDPEHRVLRLETDIRAQQAKVREASGEYAREMQDIEKRLGIVFKEFAWDDLTGELKRLPE